MLSKYPENMYIAAIGTLAGIVLILTVVWLMRSRRRVSAPPPSTTGETREQPDSAVAKVAPQDPEEIKSAPQEKKSFGLGFAKTRELLRSSFAKIMGRRLDDEVVEDLRELLFKADIGVRTVDKMLAQLKQRQNGTQEVSETMLTSELANIADSLMPVEATDLQFPSSGPLVILVIGVNGAGKTTTIAKLAHYFTTLNKKVILGAADTYRAAAIDQLASWADRVGVEIIKNQHGADPASVAFDTIKAAQARNIDVALIDTAGRLHSKTDLMAELAKIYKVVGKAQPSAPHETWLVVDSTSGSNAFAQMKSFNDTVPVTGVVATKMDGTAKGGFLIGLVDQFQKPIRFIGLGEKVSDLQPFEKSRYLQAIFS